MDAFEDDPLLPTEDEINLLAKRGYDAAGVEGMLALVLLRLRALEEKVQRQPR